MSALRVVEAVEPSCDDLFVAEVEAMLTRLGASVADDTPVEDAARIDRIAVLERLRAATAAAQAAECVRFARAQVDAQLAAEVHPRQIGRGIADQIGLACRISPTAGSRRLAAARAWWFDLPATYAALTAGQLSEPVAELVATETTHLDPVTRGQVDAELCGGDALIGLGFRAAAARIRLAAYRADPQAYVERGRTERRHRRVTLRPAPDTMALLTGYLPVEQGVACWAALGAATPTPSSPPATGGPGTRSWPTPWSNDSPARPPPPTCPSRCRSWCRSTPCSTPTPPRCQSSPATARSPPRSSASGWPVVPAPSGGGGCSPPRPGR